MNIEMWYEGEIISTVVSEYVPAPKTLFVYNGLLYEIETTTWVYPALVQVSLLDGS